MELSTNLQFAFELVLMFEEVCIKFVVQFSSSLYGSALKIDCPNTLLCRNMEA